MQRRKLVKKITDIIAFVQEHKAIMNGINVGIADGNAGRVRSHEDAMVYIAQKFDSLKQKTIFDIVQEFGKSNLDFKEDPKELYYQERAKKYGF